MACDYREMLETSARLLKLLSLLQTPREWTGTELAERLDVTTRTVRNDVDRLRELGYPVHATRGAAGGYRLGAGAALPPLLLDDEEAVAVAVGLRSGASGSIAGIEESSLRALAKLEQVLPPRLRHRLAALQAYTVAVPTNTGGPRVASDVLTVLVAACRDRQRLRFDYRAHDGSMSRRDVEPYRLVNWGRRWYLVAWDTQRADWRTYRVDRVEPRTPTGPRFAARPLPDEDLARYVSRGVGAAAWRYQAQVTARRRHRRAAARRGRSRRRDRRAHLPPADRLGQSGDARRVARHARRRLRHRQRAGAGHRPANDRRTLSARRRR
jgi:predicted DNA-binding transcriptional regulator YafY